MQVIRSIYNHIYKNVSLYFFVFLIIFTIDRHHRFEASSNPEHGPFDYDVAEYYAYLPAIFYNSQEEVSKLFITDKRTIGMSVMYLPAFITGDLIARQTGELRNGYSRPYQWSIRWESIILCIAGLFFCRKSLLFYFRENVVLISLVSILFGTNLFYYTYSTGEMPHSYLFFLYSAFIFFTLKLILSKKHRSLFWLGLIGGMITLIRPTDSMILLFPLLFKIQSFEDLKRRIAELSRYPYYLFISIILFLIPLALQMMVWRKYIGQYIYYSYTDERFFFNDPQMVNFLFSYRKGWLIYTPLMFFSLVGILLSKRHLKDFFIFLILFIPLNIYILSCWWDWSFGGSFGCRALIQSYAFLIFPFAAFVSWCFSVYENQKIKRAILRTFLVAIIFLLIQLNIFQSWQFKYQIIHWSGMNEKAYKYVFLRKALSKEELNYLYSIVTQPDPDKMKRGERD